MIEPDKRKAIYLLHVEGMTEREISRKLDVSRNTVAAIISQKGNMPDTPRKDMIKIDPDLLRRLYAECEGWIQRVYEKLTQEEKIKIAYSTLVCKIRALGLGKQRNERCSRVPDEPGEMQHDTTIYKIKIGEKLVRVIASLLYFRYSKMRYLKFYRTFDRFKMKCFFHEALTFFGYAGKVTIIDNTNLARLRGTGKNAVIVPEMEQFAKQYGFEFICHELKHPNRKAGNERSFYTVETNFLPGRTFKDWEDLNQQGFNWSTVIMANRPVSKTSLIPAKAFEYEKAYLVKLPSFIPAPYRDHERGTDQYGYASFDGNFYWVPGTKRLDIKILEYSNCIKMYYKRELLAEYPLPGPEVKNKEFSPDGQPKPGHKPQYRKKPTQQEEKKLRALSPEVDDYLNFALKPKGIQKHNFIRKLFSLSGKFALPIFIKTVQRALKYRITDMRTVEKIALLQLSDSDYEMPAAEIHSDFENKPAYLEGRLADEADLSEYDKLLEEDENGEEDGE
jgi:transposase